MWNHAHTVVYTILVAKVMRDKMLEGWKFSEPGLDELYQQNDFGSGYPSDPKCKVWMDQTLQDRVFGYSDFVRFSWAPIKTRLAANAAASSSGGAESNEAATSTTAVQPATVVFAADLDDEDMEKVQAQKSMAAFLQVPSENNYKTMLEGKKRKRSSYFKSRKLQVVHAL